MSSPDHRRPHRRSVRLPGWDYRTAGAYFLTICTYQREYLFLDEGWLAVAQMVWRQLPRRNRRVRLDEWIVMPNHLHGILVLTDGGDPTAAPFNMRAVAIPVSTEARSFANAPAGSLGAIVRSYKAAVTRRINHKALTPEHKRWQRGYYEHIIRDTADLERVRTYIRRNPERWAEDRDNLDALLERMTYHDR